MSIAAVPDYLGQDFRSASPGMRFGMYLPIWTEQADRERQIRKMASAGSRKGRELKQILDEEGMDAAIAHVEGSRGRFPDIWQKNDAAINKIWREVVKLSQDDRACIRSLVERQSASAAVFDDGLVFTLHARSTSPFTTGLGNEHPLENGFAFLWPYGLPYLPGSGVKGVVRQAARELSGGEWGEGHGWNQEKRHVVKSGKALMELSDFDLLFGLESADGGKKHFRGLLSFWDVIPEIKGDLAIDVMTPHQQHYYQGGQPPHDSGQPIPITFLTVPAGSTFAFHVTCDMQRMQRIAPHLLEQEKDTPRWQTLLTAAFAHAFEWLGFGAKTAVGYGAMDVDRQAMENAAEESARQREEEKLAKLSSEERQIEELRKRLEADKAANRKEPGGPLNEQRLKLLQAALEWQDTELRKRAATLLRETAKFLPWAKKRKKEIQEQLDRLGGTP